MPDPNETIDDARRETAVEATVDLPPSRPTTVSEETVALSSGGSTPPTHDGGPETVAFPSASSGVGPTASETTPLGPAEASRTDPDATIADPRSRPPRTVPDRRGDQTTDFSTDPSGATTDFSTDPSGATGDFSTGASGATTDYGPAGPVDADATTHPGEGGGGRDERGGGVEGSSPRGKRVRYIGDYELVDVLGQGGMGVVYRARQVSLNRPVALKMIRNAEFAGEDQVRRFLNEAEAVASLDHPGIVPVYEIGQHEDQRYFSMKLITGSGLDRRLNDLAATPAVGAKLMIEVAEAVHHAHQRGILHRDLKPANILVDTEGRAHVTDFGLAKRIEGEEGLTVTGAIMGTPSYMAPEQALGRTNQITTATDVYGLGAILYSVLTGHAPFQGNSVLDTLEQVRQRAPEPPTRRNLALPTDLEVICLKALEKEPRRRYESARALGEDLQRWLDGVPITARPVGRLERGWMWCRRNPALASLAASLVVAVIVGVAGVVYQWREAVAQRNNAVVARDEAVVSERAARKAEGEATVARDAAVVSEKAAVAAKAEAEASALLAGQQATLALSTIQDLLAQVGEKLKGPGLHEIRMGLVDVALKRVDGVAENYDKSTSKEATTLSALMELGKIYRELGRPDKALVQFRKSLDIARQRVIVKQGSDASRRNLALVLSNLGATSEELNRDMKAALDYRLESLKTYEDILATPRPDPSGIPPRLLIQYELCEATKLVALHHQRVGRLAEAKEMYLKALKLARELAAAQPSNPELQINLTKTFLGLSMAAFRTGDRAGAQALHSEMMERAEALHRARPTDPRAATNLADAYYTVGETAMFLRDLPKARAELTRCLEIRERIAKQDEKNVFQQRFLGMVLYRLGNVALLENRPDVARGFFERALKIRTALAELTVENDRRRMELMLVMAQLGRVDEAVRIAEQLAAGAKVDPEVRIDLARCFALCVRSSTADPARASALKTKALDQLAAARKDGAVERVLIDLEPDLEPLGAARNTP